jgi:hypothetical protein
LLFYSPVLLLGLWSCWLVWSRRGGAASGQPLPRPLLFGRYAALGVVAHLLIMSHWWAWHGGNAYNQRMLQEMNPLIFAVLACGLRYAAPAALRASWIALTAAWGIGMNIVVATFYDGHLNDRFREEIVWSLRDMEPLLYLRLHGPTLFTTGLLTTLLKIGAIAVVLTFLSLRLAQRKNEVLSSEF